MSENLPESKKALDPRARLEALYASFAPDVHAYARRRIDAMAVDDVVADVFVAAWRKIDQVPEVPLLWLLGVARKVIGNHARSARRRSALTRRLSTDQPRLSAVADESGDIIRALASLPERDREALMLIAWEGLAQSEAAAVMGCSPALFRVRFHRAKKKLEHALEMLADRSQLADEVRPPGPVFWPKRRNAMNSARSSSDTFELLRRANPHARPGLIDRPNASEAVGRIIERARNDWDKPTRRGRRITVALVALALLVLLVAPALALRSNIVSFFTSPKPPQTVETVVYQMAQGAPAGMDPGLVPERARLVTSMRVNGVQRDLWVAPTKAGGLCYGWVGLGGGCDKFGTIPLNISWGRRADGSAIEHIDGFIHSRYADGLELHFVNGEIVRPPLTQVTAPIDAAFFSVDIPQDKQDASHTLAAVTAVNSHGDVISTQEAPITSLGRPNPLLDAEMENKNRELVTETGAGKAAIFTAPTRYGGRCIWLELAGKRYGVAPCEPARYSFDPFSIQPITTEKAVILAGTITGKIERLQIRFADGDQVKLKPNGDGLLLYSIPAQHLTLGHEAQLVTGLDASGAEITSYRLPPNGRCYSSTLQAIPPDCPNAPLP